MPRAFRRLFAQGSIGASTAAGEANPAVPVPAAQPTHVRTAAAESTSTSAAAHPASPTQVPPASQTQRTSAPPATPPAATTTPDMSHAAATFPAPVTSPAPPTTRSPVPPSASTPSAAAGSGAAAGIYARAERAMGRGELGEARRLLGQVLQAGDAGGLAPVAAYELAQLAVRAGDLAEARERLAALRISPLSEPAEFLGCEVELRAADRDAARRCYQRFRVRHPGSAQDAEALEALLHLSPAAEDCGAGRALLDEYLARSPQGPLAPEARRRLQRCAP
jgi:hypothetical protein